MRFKYEKDGSSSSSSSSSDDDENDASGGDGGVGCSEAHAASICSTDSSVRIDECSSLALPSACSKSATHRALLFGSHLCQSASALLSRPLGLGPRIK